MGNDIFSNCFSAREWRLKRWRQIASQQYSHKPLKTKKKKNYICFLTSLPVVQHDGPFFYGFSSVYSVTISSLIRLKQIAHSLDMLQKHDVVVDHRNQCHHICERKNCPRANTLGLINNNYPTSFIK